VVFSNAERLVALVNDLLDISRIESGRIQLKSETVDLEQVTKTVVVSMQQKIKEKEQRLSVDIDRGAARVQGDKDKLVQVLTNYVSNAYKYTQAGGEIRISASRQGDFARVAVSDNGYGISPEDQARLFTRFYRVDNAMTREIGGTGLGLSIVRQLIELQGGEVGVESAPGAGSTFTFTVPLAEKPAQSLPEAVPPPLPPQVTQITQTILVVEDDPDIANLIAHYLQKAGYRVRISHSAEEALVNLEKDLPDLITLDIDLPGTRGDEFARQLHAHPLTSDIPILIISVFVDSSTGVQLGAFVLPKPIDQEQLVATVGNILQNAHPGPVLVISDDASVRSLLKSALTEQGLTVEMAASGEDGLAQARAHHPGLILLDLQMPGMDGFTVLQALKENSAVSGIPVITMTVSADLTPNTRARVLAMGASDLIARPFNLDMLVEEIRLFLTAQ
jgi:DNA-binding response OmpR family regulator/two-component sensor histidine kinase